MDFGGEEGGGNTYHWPPYLRGNTTELNNTLRMFLRHSWSVSTGVENEFYEVGFNLEPRVSPTLCQRLVTSIHYKETDTHSYLNYASSHPTGCKNSIPYSQFLRLRRICSDEIDFDEKSKEMTAFFRERGYPSRIIKGARDRVLITPREDLIQEQVDASEQQTTLPLVLTFHPQNKLVKNIITRNFHLLRDDRDTGAIFRPLRILCACRRDTNLRDSLVRSSFNDATAASVDRGTFPCGRTRGNTCAHTNASSSIDNPGGRITVHDKYTCTSSNVVYLIRCRACGKVYIGETGRRLGDRFREHLRSTRLTDTDLPVGRHFASSGHSVEDMSVSVIRSGFQSTLDRRRFEAKAIFQHRTLHPEGLNTDFSFI